MIVQGLYRQRRHLPRPQMTSSTAPTWWAVSPHKGGQKHLNKPVFDTVSEAVRATGADVSIIFVPPAFAADAIMEAAEAGIKVIVAITEGHSREGHGGCQGVPARQGLHLIGPNCPGVITADECKVGIMPGFSSRGRWASCRSPAPSPTRPPTRS